MEKEIAIIYNYLTFTGWIILATLGTALAMTVSPKGEFYKPYVLSKRILSIGFIILAFELLVLWGSEYRVTNNDLASIIDIVGSYSFALCFGTAFISLIDPSFLNTKEAVKNGLHLIVVTLLLMVSYYVTHIFHIACETLALVIILADLIRFVRLFFSEYKLSMTKMDNYFATDYHPAMRWIYRAFWGVLILGLFGALIAFFGIYASMVQIVVSFFVYIYIYVSYVNFIIDFHIIQRAKQMEKIPDAPVGWSQKLSAADASSANKAHKPADPSSTANLSMGIATFESDIKTKIDYWVDKKYYTSADLTIDDVSRQMMTNRTYLSAYLNNELGITFREWIQRLRIDEAKRLFREQPKLTTAQVADACGLSSASNLSHQFKMTVGISPREWIKLQKQGM